MAVHSKVDTTRQGHEPITTPVMPQGQPTSPSPLPYSPPPWRTSHINTTASLFSVPSMSPLQPFKWGKQRGKEGNGMWGDLIGRAVVSLLPHCQDLSLCLSLRTACQLSWAKPFGWQYITQDMHVERSSSRATWEKCTVSLDFRQCLNMLKILKESILVIYVKQHGFSHIAN